MPTITSRPSVRIAALVALLPATGIADHPSAPRAPGVADRPSSPLELGSLLARHDREPDGPAKRELAAVIDATAHQKYATVSRLYWHTDLATAQAAAREQQRPILHLRMLGRLDEELSCANSRLFRTTLYANTEVSTLLRDSFVLYWSTERPVPRVTIDFGDGRKLEQTTTGNSAHYVMDADGNVLDVLPGLYAPVAFRTELAGSLALATKLRGATDAERTKAIAAYHQAEVAAADAAWQRTARWRLDVDEAAAIVEAQRATITKAVMEVPQLQRTAIVPADAFPVERVDKWVETAQQLYGFGRPRTTPILDEQSRALVARLHDALPAELRTTPAARAAMIARLERHIAADTALNQLRLRPQISREIARRGGVLDFTALNDWVYASVFHTPKTDAWLGLLPRTDFTGLPGDGVVMP